MAKEPLAGDAEALADLRRDEDARTAFSLYLRAKGGFHEAIVTLTDEGDLVLGLGLDDPLDGSSLQRQASDVLAQVMDGFGGRAGIGGVELSPPQSAAEWTEDALVMMRVGSI